VSTPGEVMQAIGQAYQYVFIGALEASIRPFENKFNVHTNPEKTSFKGRGGKAYSFDFNGEYNHPWMHSEVFGECKGYSKGKNPLDEFRCFIAKAYVTSVDYERHREDLFWFVTNVPFACSEGSGIRSYDFVSLSLQNAKSEGVKEIIGEGHVDDAAIRSLVQRLGVFILTDSFLKNTDISYKVMPGESLWVILKKLHGGHSPSAFRSIAGHVASRNGLPSPDRITSGRRIRLPWFGIKKRAENKASAEF
jgi:hypothetical protein